MQLYSINFSIFALVPGMEYGGNITFFDGPLKGKSFCFQVGNLMTSPYGMRFRVKTNHRSYMISGSHPVVGHDEMIPDPDHLSILVNSVLCVVGQTAHIFMSANPISYRTTSSLKGCNVKYTFVHTSDQIIGIPVE